MVHVFLIYFIKHKNVKCEIIDKLELDPNKSVSEKLKSGINICLNSDKKIVIY